MLHTNGLPKMLLNRRMVLTLAMAKAGLVAVTPVRALTAEGLRIDNVTGLYAVEVAPVAAPRTAGELSAPLAAWPGQVARWPSAAAATAWAARRRSGAAAITEVELDLTDNIRLERVVEEVALADYERYVKTQVLANPRVVMHNADLLPPRFDAPVWVSRQAARDRGPSADRGRAMPCLRSSRRRIRKSRHCVASSSATIRRASSRTNFGAVICHGARCFRPWPTSACP